MHREQKPLSVLRTAACESISIMGKLVFVSLRTKPKPEQTLCVRQSAFKKRRKKFRFRHLFPLTPGGLISVGRHRLVTPVSTHFRLPAKSVLTEPSALSPVVHPTSAARLPDQMVEEACFQWMP